GPLLAGPRNHPQGAREVVPQHVSAGDRTEMNYGRSAHWIRSALSFEIMTSDPAQPVTKPETFRSHLPAIAAAAAGTLLAAVLGSLIGAAGTVAGMAIGSLVSGTCSWWAEQGIRRSGAVAAARAAAIRARGRPLRP